MNQVPKGLSAAALVATVAVSSVTQAQLEEVIVTATKIETSIQDTPIAVSAFTQDQLDSQLIRLNFCQCREHHSSQLL